jgi:hypothetical protein
MDFMIDADQPAIRSLGFGGSSLERAALVALLPAR